jgi:hypothetical protein
MDSSASRCARSSSDCAAARSASPSGPEGADDGAGGGRVLVVPLPLGRGGRQTGREGLPVLRLRSLLVDGQENLQPVLVGLDLQAGLLQGGQLGRLLGPALQVALAFFA